MRGLATNYYFHDPKISFGMTRTVGGTRREKINSIQKVQFKKVIIHYVNCLFRDNNAGETRRNTRSELKRLFCNS